MASNHQTSLLRWQSSDQSLRRSRNSTRNKTQKLIKTRAARNLRAYSHLPKSYTLCKLKAPLALHVATEHSLQKWWHLEEAEVPNGCRGAHTAPTWAPEEPANLPGLSFPLPAGTHEEVCDVRTASHLPTAKTWKSPRDSNCKMRQPHGNNQPAWDSFWSDRSVMALKRTKNCWEKV